MGRRRKEQGRTSSGNQSHAAANFRADPIRPRHQQDAQSFRWPRLAAVPRDVLEAALTASVNPTASDILARYKPEVSRP